MASHGGVKRPRFALEEVDPDPEQELEEARGPAGVDTLRHMAFWDTVSWESQCTWVPTLGTVPLDMCHAVAVFKGALLRARSEAKGSGNVAEQLRCLKAIHFVDRLLFATSAKRRVSTKVVADRLRRAWRGEWAGLWAEASDACVNPRTRGGGASAVLKEDARAINTYVKEGLLARAVARARGAFKVDLGDAAVRTAEALFTVGDAWAGGPATPVSDELRASLLAVAARGIRRFPRKSGPGPNGSRFEHWGVLQHDADALQAGAEFVVDFLFGGVPEEALKANLGARLVPLLKPSGGVRAIAMGSVVRRLAARAACAVVKPRVAAAVGPQQYGVGKKAGCELVHKCITALTDEDASRVVVAFDASNAFGTLPRQFIWNGVSARLPELTSTVLAWLGKPTEHVLWDSRGRAHRVESNVGVDQGCPLSPLLFSLALAEALQSLSEQLRLLDPAAHVFAYLDDVVVVTPAPVAGRVAATVERALAGVGLTVNGGKTKVWTRDPTVNLPAQLEQRRVDSLGVLGASVPWLDREEGELDAPVNAHSNGTQALAACRSLVQRVKELRDSGLSVLAAYQVLRLYSQTSFTHLQRTSYEKGAWVGELDGVLCEGLDHLLGDVTSAQQRELASFRLADGGLALGGVRKRSAPAYLASWCLCLSDVAGLLGVTSLEGFRSRCPGVWTSLSEAERELRTLGANSGRPLAWNDYLREPAPKLQGLWGKEISIEQRAAMLNALPEEDAVDVRSNGGTGAGSFLLPPTGGVVNLLDDHFNTLLRDRVLLPVCTEGALCQHRRPDGRLCNAPLDRRGRHARMCGVGGGRGARHNRVRDWFCATYSACTGLLAVSERHAPQWDVVDPGTQEVVQARLDVATSDSRTGLPLYLDVVVKCAYSVDRATLRARARRDGRAASDAAAEKRRRYRDAGNSLVPLAFEAGGRPSDSAAQFMRQLGAAWAETHASEDGERPAPVTGVLWQQVSSVLQLGNAELILSANGR